LLSFTQEGNNHSIPPESPNTSEVENESEVLFMAGGNYTILFFFFTVVGFLIGWLFEIHFMLVLLRI